MSSSGCCFVHASDFHLERPLYGISHVPEPLREAFVEAPYLAAERVFETAATHRADFVLLAGDVLDVELAGPRALAFLTAQFEKLAARGIAVLWAGGRVDDPASWPEGVRWPDNVYVFPVGKPVERRVERGGHLVARIVGASRTIDGQPELAHFAVPRSTSPAPLIGVGHGQYDGLPSIRGAADGGAASAVERDAAEPLVQSAAVDYWALGGGHAPQRLDAPGVWGGMAGTPQGRQPRDVGVRGCQLVRCQTDVPPEATLVPTDFLRWQRPQVAIDETTRRIDLERTLAERLRTLVTTHQGTDLLAAWTVTGSGPLAAALRQGNYIEEMLGELNTEFARGASAAWSVSLTIEPPTQLPPAWYEEDTILGDFLRAMRDPVAAGWMRPDAPLPDLSVYAPEDVVGSELAARAALREPRQAERVLRQAAALGASLLGGEGA